MEPARGNRPRRSQALHGEPLADGGGRILRRTILVAAVALLAASSSGAAPLPDTPLLSGNLTLLGTIPETGAIGGQIRVVETLYGPRQYFVLTTVRGVSVYDLLMPEAPVLVGHLPLPHWENEDVNFGDDTLIISQDPQWFFASIYGQPELAGGLYLIDISNLPALSFAYVNPATGNRWTAPVGNYSGHTTTCTDASCDYAYVNGTSSVTIADLRDPSDPRVAGQFSSGVGSTHDAQVDEAGILWMVGSGGIAGYDVSNPVLPRRVSTTFGSLNYHHNSWRPRADEWTPRAPGDGDPTVRPGELALITEEEFYPPPLGPQTLCQNQGRFGTYWIRDTDALAAGTALASIEQLDVWQTEAAVLGYTPTAPACSAHYLDERDGIVAIAWYEQGLRLLDVSDPRDIRQIGYYIGPATVAWNVRWAGEGALGGEILYTIDGTRGVDILRFERPPDAPTVTAPMLEQWFAPRPFDLDAIAPHPVWGYACRLPTL